jgi:hypothetical protein
MEWANVGVDVARCLAVAELTVVLHWRGCSLTADTTFCLHLLILPRSAAAAAAATCPPADFPIKHPVNGLPCTLQRLAAA